MKTIPKTLRIHFQQKTVYHKYKYKYKYLLTLLWPKGRTT